MELLGQHPMPWQEYAADVIGEVDERGLPRWPTVIISVPRQSGKSALMAAVAVHRALTKPRGRIWLTAQTGADAADLWHETYERVSTSPLAAAFSWRKANGTQNMTCNITGATYKPHPPTEEKLHGKQSDLNIIDEAWALDEVQAENLMQAIEPTQATRAGAQIVIVSTMGTAKSGWFHGMVEKARAGEAGIALLDWGIGPEDDPMDLEVVAEHHPAFGHTITEKALYTARSRFANNPAGFARAYGNRATGAVERLIPVENWTAAINAEPIPVDARVSFGAAVDIDRTSAAIAAAWQHEDGRVFIEIVEAKDGTSWAADRIRALLERHDNTGIIVDRVGPAGYLFDELERSGVDVRPVKVPELTAGTAEFYDRVMHDPPRIVVRDDQRLNESIEVVERRLIGDSWTWSRRGSARSIAPLEAATLALIGATHLEPEPAAPLVYGFEL